MKPGPRPVMNEYLLSPKDVMAKCQIGQTLLNELVREGRFPQPRQVNKRVLRWRGSDVDAWIRELPQDMQRSA
jgi:predicted DNA-binding transcriptional regulator AlpA